MMIGISLVYVRYFLIVHTQGALNGKKKNLEIFDMNSRVHTYQIMKSFNTNDDIKIIP